MLARNSNLQIAPAVSTLGSAAFSSVSPTNEQRRRYIMEAAVKAVDWLNIICSRQNGTGTPRLPGFSIEARCCSSSQSKVEVRHIQRRQRHGATFNMRCFHINGRGGNAHDTKWTAYQFGCHRASEVTVRGNTAIKSSGAQCTCTYRMYTYYSHLICPTNPKIWRSTFGATQMRSTEMCIMS